ncbi:prephenate dehydrogenase [Methanosarcina sp. 2.H.T.1A.6]|uniref:prephenate dehydrogenase n=1 Tax=unclassified Methanosarcina TaxID=2644672 RepID=UPI000622571A|nr:MULTISPECIES: prephenate dehydrogenase [unclassified Methanosarcina]KKG11587.1 prephenate dehydrogenase [Methanosarcina sp. 2.H.T.1A.15]KKG14461.1 prephenate dehydrogenase [Methanosarcina sp. 2.H.T.1A.3]KKG24287.1 prephenate dehydrogenase [Methanosarcina sp. 2.H.T.1A.8]KKG24900.1 prephenate dehydrogenase [Methanosarcina sp. 2.H.T.1A.6]
MNTDPEKHSSGKTKVLILGGTGEMGQWFTHFFKERDYEVTVWGKGGKVEVARKLNVPFASDLEAAIPENDIVIVSVPINATEETIAEVAPKMKAGSLLMDFTSTKVKPVEAMRRFAPANVEILGTHPMFGPTIPTIRGQTVILVPVKGRSEKWFPVIRQLFEESGAHVEITTAAEHDRLVSVVQGLTHFAYIAIGTTIDRLDFDIKKSRKFVSPVYSIMLDFVGRILGQNPYLYALIQMENPGVPEVHEAFIKECEELSSLVRAHDEEGFVKKMKAAARKYDDTAHALRRSDKLINSRITEYETIMNSVGKVCGFSHFYSGKVHVGTLEKVGPNEIIITKLASKGTAPHIKNKFIKLKLENLRLLSESELREWRKENLKHAIRDISVLIPEGADPEVILSAVNTNNHLVACQISDTYNGTKGTEAENERRGTDRLGVTYRITIFGDCSSDSVETEVTTLLCGLGCRVREKNLRLKE